MEASFRGRYGVRPPGRNSIPSALSGGVDGYESCRCRSGRAALPLIVYIIPHLPFFVKRGLTGRAGCGTMRTETTAEKNRERGVSIPVDSNLAERAVKPFVIGRKNWLFSTSVKGADTSARIYSILNTALLNGLNAEEYLVKVFRSPGELILPFQTKAE